MEALFKLRQAIARKTPCVLLPIISDFNAMGLYLALHQSGIDPSRSPQVQGDLLHYHPKSGDALLCIGSDPFWFFSDTQIEAIRASDLPVIALSALQNQTTHAADLVLPVALSGVEAEGLAFRMDGIPIYLRKILPTAQPTDRAVLRALSQNLGGDPFHG
jgi:formylmethanofuran dehydrogenase subunit B